MPNAHESHDSHSLLRTSEFQMKKNRQIGASLIHIKCTYTWIESSESIHKLSHHFLILFRRLVGVVRGLFEQKKNSMIMEQ